MDLVFFFRLILLRFSSGGLDGFGISRFGASCLDVSWFRVGCFGVATGLIRCVVAAFVVARQHTRQDVGLRWWH